MRWPGWLSKSQVIQFITCPHSWYISKIEKVRPKYVEELNNGKEIHKSLEDIYDRKEKFSSEKEIIEELEKLENFEKFSEQFKNFSRMLPKFTMRRPIFRELKITDRYNKLRAIVDRIDRIDNMLCVGEYKWSTKWPWTDFELSLYALLVEKRWGNAVNKGAVFYLSDGKLTTIEITNRMKNDALKIVENVRKDIHKRLKHSHFEKKNGEHCKNCPYKWYCKS